jgi:hypothetical protein
MMIQMTKEVISIMGAQQVRALATAQPSQKQKVPSMQRKCLMM